MADNVILPYPVSGANLYFHALNAAGQRWNTATPGFENYDDANWADYGIAFAEQGASRVYLAAFPADAPAGLYSVIVYEQAGASPAETDNPIFGADGDWDGDNFVVVGDVTTVLAEISAGVTATPGLTATEVLAVPANKLATDDAGAVTVTAASASAVATAVWAAGTRTLTSFGTLAATVAAAVWAYSGGRTLSAFAFTVTTSLGSAMHTILLKLDTMLEGSGPYTYTAPALAAAPGGDATEAGQIAILAAIGDLEDASVADIVSGILAVEVETGLTLGNLLKDVRAWAGGKVVRTSDAGANPLVLAFYDYAGATPRFTLTIQRDGSGRTSA